MPAARFPSMRLPCTLSMALWLCACATSHFNASAPQIDARIPDGEWELTTSSFIESGRMPGIPRAKIAFRDGRMSAFSGCNSATANVRNASGRLAASDLVKTHRDCPQPVGVFDARFFDLLRAEPVYRIEGDVLTIAANDHSARFKRIQ